jgi:hypothetical protein
MVHLTVVRAPKTVRAEQRQRSSNRYTRHVASLHAAKMNCRIVVALKQAARRWASILQHDNQQ